MQNGLLTEGQDLKSQDLKTMSLYLGQLENVKNSSGAVIRAARIPKLLREIRGVKNLSTDGNFCITE